MDHNQYIKKMVSIISITGIVLSVCAYGVFSYVDHIQNNPGNTTPFSRLSSGNATPVPTLTPSGIALMGSTTAKAEAADGLVDMINNILPSVAGISSAKITDVSQLFLPDKEQTWSVGSGIIVTDDGYILTNQHVVGDVSKEIRVSLSDGRMAKGKTVWQDAGIDLAVVKIDEKGLTPAVLGDAKLCRVGQRAIAIGNPLGLQFQRTVTQGVISATYRTVSTENESGEKVFMEDLLQTDASINPGNSGGPLLNENGEVVGINTIKVSSAEGIGFAVPINIAKPIVESIASSGSFSTPYFGIYGYDRSIIDYINQDFGTKTGIYVVSVDEGSPAQKIGIKEGDIITHINKIGINTMMDFREQVYRLAPKTEIGITYISDGKILEANTRLGSR